MGYFIACVIGLGLCAAGVGLDLLANWRARKRAAEREWRKKVLEEQRVEAARSKRMMEELMETEGWKFIAEAAKMQSVRRQNEVLLKPTENPLAQEYLKGEVQGIELFVTLPEKLIENAQAIIDLAMQEGGQ